jgi:16S rRNA G966 N2-methylase RsmD
MSTTGGPAMTPYYEQGGVTIYHGNAAEVVPALAVQADLVVTDPPYAPGAARSEWRVTAEVAIALHAAARQVPKGGAMAVLSSSSGRGVDYVRGAVGATLALNRVLVWHKAFVRSRVAGPWRWDVVLALVFGRGSWGRPEHSSVFESTGPCSRNHLGDTGHPAELPEGLAEWLTRPFLEAGAQVLLDPFCGTGALLAPAARGRRQVIGVESEERWCEQAARRLSQGVLPLEGVGG